MRALHILPRYWPFYGGSPRHMQEYCERLAADGHQVTVATSDAFDLEYFWNPSKRRIEQTEETHNGVRILRFPVRHLPAPRYSFGVVRRALVALSPLRLTPLALLRRLVRYAPYMPEFDRYLAAHLAEYDIIHGMDIVFDRLLTPAWQGARKRGIPFLISPLTHLGEANDRRVRQYYTMRQQVALVKGAQRAFMQTEIERRFYLQQGADAGRLTIAGVGVDPAAMLGGSAERFRQKYGIDLPFVTYIGAMAYDKGTEHLVEAMRFLWDKRRQEPLVLAGPDMESFTRFLEKQDAIVQRNVRHLGYISEEDKRDLLAAADVLAMPSRTDSFGIVFLEAWLNRKPVIGARAGGIPAVISEGEDGLLVDFGDAHELAAKIELLLDDQSLRERLGESGYRKTMAHYTWDRIWPIVRQGYERALAELGRGQ